jgi:hypothetical protein
MFFVEKLMIVFNIVSACLLTCAVILADVPILFLALAACNLCMAAYLMTQGE